MTAACQPLPRSVAEDMLQVVARALCDHPGDNARQRESRTRQMVHSTMGLEPRDGLEYMLSTLVFGHFNLILDSMHDVFLGQASPVKAKTNTTIVALGRSMVAMVKELRMARKRPTAQAAEDVKTATENDASSQDVVLEIRDEPPPGPEKSEAPSALPTDHIQTRNLAPVLSPRRGAASGLAPDRDTDDSKFEEHITAFQDAMTAMGETLKDAQALDDARLKAATGD